jgi:hypothetical protein
MPSKTGSVTAYVALGLAAAVAALSGLYHAGQAEPGLRWLLLTTAAPEAAATAGAIGETPEFPVSP